MSIRQLSATGFLVALILAACPSFGVAQVLVGGGLSNASGASSSPGGISMSASLGGPPVGTVSGGNLSASFGGTAVVQAGSLAIPAAPVQTPVVNSSLPVAGGGGGCVASPHQDLTGAWFLSLVGFLLVLLRRRAWSLEKEWTI